MSKYAGYNQARSWSAFNSTPPDDEAYEGPKPLRRIGGKGADPVGKAIVNFLAGALMGYSSAKFTGEMGAHIAKSQGLIMGQSLSKLMSITAGLGIAGISPEGIYGTGVSVGSLLTLIPYLKDPPTISGLASDLAENVYSAAKDYATQIGRNVSGWWSAESMSWGQSWGLDYADWTGGLSDLTPLPSSSMHHMPSFMVGPAPEPGFRGWYYGK